jgi:hypothetical protein
MNRSWRDGIAEEKIGILDIGKMEYWDDGGSRPRKKCKMMIRVQLIKFLSYAIFSYLI